MGIAQFHIKSDRLDRHMYIFFYWVIWRLILGHGLKIKISFSKKWQGKFLILLEKSRFWLDIRKSFLC